MREDLVGVVLSGEETGATLRLIPRVEPITEVPEGEPQEEARRSSRKATILKRRSGGTGPHRQQRRKRRPRTKKPDAKSSAGRIKRPRRPTAGRRKARADRPASCPAL